jgi:hypothetical protein
MPGPSSGYQASAYSSDPYSTPAKPTVPTSTRKHLPQTTYATFKAAEIATILRKIKAFNGEVPPQTVVLSSPS